MPKNPSFSIGDLIVPSDTYNGVEVRVLHGQEPYSIHDAEKIMVKNEVFVVTNFSAFFGAQLYIQKFRGGNFLSNSETAVGNIATGMGWDFLNMTKVRDVIYSNLKYKGDDNLWLEIL